MKKVSRILACAFLAMGMVMTVSCGDDDEGNNGNGGNNGGNTENLPTTIDENFDNGIPATWTTIDADGDGITWMMCSEYFSETYGVDGSDCVMSPSYINNIGPLTSDNYLVTPKIYIEDGATLSYQITNFQAEYPDPYSVLIGTLENGEFTSVGTLVPEEQVETGAYDGNGAYTSRSVDLSAYKGQSLCIAFRHNATDCYWLLLDNVKVTK